MLISSNLQANTLRIGTYNIWNPVFEEKYAGQNTWDKRLPFLIENILSSQCDLICFEEVGKNSYLDLVQNAEINRDFMSFYIPHAVSKPGQKEGRDGLAFFYRPEKMALTKLVQSQDGTRPTHRRDFYVDLKLKEKPAVQFRVACTHIDSDSIALGNAQLSALVEDVTACDPEIDFIVLCGDFNEGAEESSRPRYEIMHQAGFITDGSVEPTRPEAINTRHKGHVDWIYFKNLSDLNLTLKALSPIGDERASDHKLTLTEVEIK